MFDDNCFIEYIGISSIPLKYKDKNLIESFIEDELEFKDLIDIEISRVYINLSNECVDILEEDIIFYTIRAELNIEYINNETFGEVNIKNFKYYKSFFIKNIESLDLSLHNFASYINIIKIANLKYYIYLNIKSIYL